MTERKKIWSYKFSEFNTNDMYYLRTKFKRRFIWNSYNFPKKAQHCNHFLIFNMWYVTLKGIISLPLKMQKSMLCNSKQFETKSMHYIFLDFFLRHCFQGNCLKKTPSKSLTVWPMMRVSFDPPTSKDAKRGSACYSTGLSVLGVIGE